MLRSRARAPPPRLPLPLLLRTVKSSRRRSHGGDGREATERKGRMRGDLVSPRGTPPEVPCHFRYALRQHVFWDWSKGILNSLCASSASLPLPSPSTSDLCGFRVVQVDALAAASAEAARAAEAQMAALRGDLEAATARVGELERLAESARAEVDSTMWAVREGKRGGEGGRERRERRVGKRRRDAHAFPRPRPRSGNTSREKGRLTMKTVCDRGLRADLLLTGRNLLQGLRHCAWSLPCLATLREPCVHRRRSSCVHAWMRRPLNWRRAPQRWPSCAQAAQPLPSSSLPRRRVCRHSPNRSAMGEG